MIRATITPNSPTALPNIRIKRTLTNSVLFWESASAPPDPTIPTHSPQPRLQKPAIIPAPNIMNPMYTSSSHYTDQSLQTHAARWKNTYVLRNMSVTSFVCRPRKPPIIRKDLGDISYIGRVMTDFVRNFVAMATGVGRSKICLASFNSRTLRNADMLQKVDYT